MSTGPPDASAVAKRGQARASSSATVRGMAPSSGLSDSSMPAVAARA
ncbi:MAG TPA: hypothetical protein VKI99_13730 [Candidatus Dormibacteraeota bacterium]|nr:hypothetical protein [Candidatus Dormibacteraeota bacterium]